MIKITAWLFVLIEILFFLGGGGWNLCHQIFAAFKSDIYVIENEGNVCCVYVPCKDFGFDFLICD